MTNFDSDEWLKQRRDELVNLMFLNEFGIPDFKNSSKIINFDDLQSEVLIEKVGKYRKALRSFFDPADVRSLLDYYYINQDKKPLLNLLKQLLRYYGYELNRVSEYQGTHDGVKTYKSRYTIGEIKSIDKGAEPP